MEVTHLEPGTTLREPESLQDTSITILNGAQLTISHHAITMLMANMKDVLEKSQLPSVLNLAHLNQEKHTMMINGMPLRCTQFHPMLRRSKLKL